MKQKRLAIFLPSLAGGGAEKSMLRLVSNIARYGYTPDLVLVKAEGDYLSSLPENIRLINLKAPRAILSLPALVIYLKREKPDVMLSNLDFLNVIAVWARRITRIPKKMAIYEHNTMSMTSNHSSQWRQRIVPFLVKLFYPWADDIICVSEGVAEDLCRVTGLSRRQIKVIYNIVITPELYDKRKVPLNDPWFETSQPPVVLAVGRLTPQKDFTTLIKAFAQVHKSIPARLVILGEGPERTELETMVKKLGINRDVRLAGFVDNPYAYMSRASLFVLSSRWEGLPTVLIEALFCGVPVIATDCPSGPREILENGQYGRLVPVQDVDALADAIRAALNGETPPPLPESWQPYKLETVADQYLKLLLSD